MPSRLDQTDLAILELLQKDASASVAEIADKVGLSQSPCWRRIQRLERDGFVRERIAVLDRYKLGLNLEVFAHVRFQRDQPDTLARFEAAVRAAQEIVECHMLMGDVDFLLRVVTRDVASYERFLRDTLALMPGVREVRSTIALSTIKNSRQLPLRLSAETPIDNQA
ncbi:MAG: Lrp/AsnC family transcriptional regulator [Steroidobacteraceae bacterium]|nr:Lrp/AsnC family transcriptional regulator [Steroidobacteraceae bacterium]MDW8259857.1 Lrp/AsnC family transcriptional regulator [Gammaproteobacteria bacterium]